MKDYKKEYESVVIEGKLRLLINQAGHYKCLNSEGELSDRFKLFYLIRNHKAFAEEHNKLLIAFHELKKQKLFIKQSNNKVSEETLDSIVLLAEILIRPLKHTPDQDTSFHRGEIIKMPATQSEFNEEWRSLIETDRKLNVGDKVLYPQETTIVLDGEELHLVSWVTAKLLK